MVKLWGEDELAKRLVQLAQQERRTVLSQVVVLLECAFGMRPPLPQWEEQEAEAQDVPS